MKLLLVDDHQIFREGVREFLQRESFCTQIDDADSVTAAREIIERAEPDIVITDISFPESSGKELIAWTSREHPRTRCLCMTMHAGIGLLREVLGLGAHGFVTKSSGYDELVAAIRTVAGGGRYLDQTMLTQVLDHLVNGMGAAGIGSTAAAALSERERGVLMLLLEDRELSDIAEALFISRKTVENHRSNIYRKLGVHDRLSLFRFGRDAGLVE